MKNLLAFVLLLIHCAISSQEIYFVKDQLTHESIPFVKIIPDKGSPLLADIDGAFPLKEQGILSVRLTTFGYSDTLILLSSVINNELFLNPISKQIEEVVVLPGENPAHRIMNKVIANRKKNNPVDNDAFRYESYSKFIFDINQDALKAISDTTTDTKLRKIKDLFNTQHLLILESASRRTFIPPARDKEEIIAYKVSGFTDPMLSTFAHEMQSFSFYENQFELLGKTYLNPIAFGGTNRYLFLLQDTMVINQDTTFTISFRPRKGKNFDGLRGTLYINTKGYAIEKVITEPAAEDEAMPVKIVQEYVFVGNEKWFPSKLSTEISFPTITVTEDVEDGFITGKGSTYIKNIEFNPKGERRFSFDNTSISTAENANAISEKEWDSLRVYAIDTKDKNTYQILDSMPELKKADRTLKALKVLMEGKVPMGYLNLDLLRLYDFDLYEGHRVGLGLETSKKLAKKASIGAYFAYGTTDKDWKYGAYSTLNLYAPKYIQLRLAYQQDVAERGFSPLHKEASTVQMTDFFRHLYIQNMDQQRLAEVVLSSYLTSNFKVSILGNYQHIQSSGGYIFQALDSLYSQPTQQYNLAETGFEIKWNLREKMMILGDTRVSKGTKFPKINFQLKKGWKGWALSDFEYWRMYASIEQDVQLRAIGKLSWCLSGGQTIGETPLFLSQVSIGTGKNWNLSVKNTFETMAPSEFYSTQQAALFTRFRFQSIKTSKNWFQPQFGLYHGMGIGTFDHAEQHSFAFKTMEKGYFEAGISCDKIISSALSGFGVGVYYRYGAYSDLNAQKNIYLKVQMSIAF